MILAASCGQLRCGIYVGKTSRSTPKFTPPTVQPMGDDDDQNDDEEDDDDDDEDDED